jgi:hypothetical protein
MSWMIATVILARANAITQPTSAAVGTSATGVSNPETAMPGCSVSEENAPRPYVKICDLKSRGVGHVQHGRRLRA